MDRDFFSKRLFSIAFYQYQYIPFKIERLYYFKYIRKLRYHLITLGYDGKNDVDKALSYIHAFEDRESRRIKNGFICKPKKALHLACSDAKDVVESMRRYEGIES